MQIKLKSNLIVAVLFTNKSIALRISLTAKYGGLFLSTAYFFIIKRLFLSTIQTPIERAVDAPHKTSIIRCFSFALRPLKFIIAGFSRKKLIISKQSSVEDGVKTLTSFVPLFSCNALKFLIPFPENFTAYAYHIRTCFYAKRVVVRHT